jgi:integrase
MCSPVHPDPVIHVSPADLPAIVRAFLSTSIPSNAERRHEHMPKKKTSTRTRAPRGHGSIKIDERAGRYRWRFESGKKLIATGTTDTEPDAIRDAGNARSDFLRGTLTYSESMTLQEYATRWLKRRTALETKTQNGYKQTLDLALEHIGQLKLKEVRPHHIRDALAKIAERTGSAGMGKGRPTSSRTLAHVLARLKNIFIEAQGDGLIHTIPTLTVKPVKTIRTEHVGIALNEPQHARFQHVGTFLHDHGHARLWPALATCAAIGLRRSEVLGLQWHHIDLETDTLLIRQGIVSVSGKMELHELPKTDSGRRDIPILPELRTILLEQKEHLEQYLQSIRHDWTNTLPVFPTSELLYTYPDNLNRSLKEIIFWSDPTTQPAPRRGDNPKLPPLPADEALENRLLGIKETDRAAFRTIAQTDKPLPIISPHDLRHTFATRMLQSDMPVSVVSKILGHASVTITLETYRHVDAGEIRARFLDTNAKMQKNLKDQ